MKKLKLILFSLAALALVSCNSADENTQEHSHEKTNIQAENHPENNTGLQLNNGRKWESDAATRSAFANMQTIVRIFSENTKTPDISDYNELGNDMQQELNILFKECTMEGEAHDQLHLWLEGIIAEVKTLKDNDENAAAVAYKSLTAQLNLFPEYFN